MFVDTFLRVTKEVCLILLTEEVVWAVVWHVSFLVVVGECVKFARERSVGALLLTDFSRVE